jgi:hypothetical protein
MAGELELSAILDADALVRADDAAVLVDSPERHLVDNLASTRRQPRDVAIA